MPGGTAAMPFDEATTRALARYAAERKAGPGVHRRVAEAALWAAVGIAAAWVGDGKRNAYEMHARPDSRVDAVALYAFYTCLAVQGSICLYLAVTAPHANWNETHPAACATGAALMLVAWAAWSGAFWGVFGYAAPFVCALYFFCAMHTLWFLPLPGYQSRSSKRDA